jgi:hypothetical protein
MIEVRERLKLAFSHSLHIAGPWISEINREGMSKKMPSVHASMQLIK